MKIAVFLVTFCVGVIAGRIVVGHYYGITDSYNFSWERWISQKIWKQ